MKLARTALERLSRHVTFTRKLPPECGGATLFVTPDASLRLWRQDLGKADPLLLQIAREVIPTGSVTWDVGANVGLFSFTASALAGRSGHVLAIEPDPLLTRLLQKSASCLNSSFAPVTVLELALSDRLGEARFHISSNGRARNHLAGTSTAARRQRRQTLCVKTTTLDLLLKDHRAPDVLKIDAEGAEALILAGGRTVLDDVRPALVIEVVTSRPEITAMLRQHRYTLYDGSSTEPRVIDSCVWNTIAVPSERRL